MVARAELQHVQNLLALVHTHLERHHATLERNLPSNTPAAGRAALAGIKEVWDYGCHFISFKAMSDRQIIHLSYFCTAAVFSVRLLTSYASKNI